VRSRTERGFPLARIAGFSASPGQNPLGVGIKEDNLGKGLFNRVQGELEAREKLPGLTMADILTFPEPLCGLLNWMIRKGPVEFAEVTAFLQQDDGAARAVLVDLLAKGLIREIEMHGVTQYRVRLARSRGREIPLNLWQALNDKVEE
jgi:hypothetical protein